MTEVTCDSVDLCLAPIRGITDYVYRDAFSKLFEGVDRAIAPFIKTTQRGPVDKEFTDLAPDKNKRMRVTPQLLSKSAAHFVLYAEHLKSLGYTEINWNLGCPHPVVSRKGLGAGLLKQPDIVRRFLDEYYSAATLPLSIKTRLGLDDPTQLLELVPVFNNYPLRELIIHPRTAEDMYVGPLDHEMFTRCLELSTANVMYNGEINSLAEFEQLQKKFRNVRRWMLGRGLLSNPTLAAQIRGDKASHVSSKHLIKELHDQLYKTYRETLNGPSHILSKMNAHFEYLARQTNVDDRFLKKLGKTKQLAAYEALVAKSFDGADGK